MFRNVAGQRVTVFAFDRATLLPRIGDAANITAYQSKDYAAPVALADLTATELDSTEAAGYYVFDLTQAETNAGVILFTARSATPDTVVIGVPAVVFPEPGGAFKNSSGQRLIVFAFDRTTNQPKPMDAANLTAYVSKDNAAPAALADTSATELDAVKAAGYYLFDLSQAETNADTLLFTAKSATGNVQVIGMPAVLSTVPGAFPAIDTTSVLGNMLDAVGQTLTALALSRPAGGALKIVRRFSFTADWARALEKPIIAYGPAGILSPLGGTNIRKDTAYPLTVRVLAAADKEDPDQQILYLAWVKAIRNALERKRLGDQGEYNCVLQPGPLIEPDAAALNILSLVLVYQVQAREAA